MQQWDPIGVNSIPEAADEYDGYIGEIYELLSAKTSEQQLASHLQKIEVDRMGLDGFHPQAIAARTATALSVVAIIGDLEGSITTA